MHWTGREARPMAQLSKASTAGASAARNDDEPGSLLRDVPRLNKCLSSTSPQDQMILEAAYKNDPKPDKAARLELVKQIPLGEKEVQVRSTTRHVDHERCFNNVYADLVSES